MLLKNNPNVLSLMLHNPINDLNSYSAVTPVIRYAEVLLSYLECLIESGQAIDQTVLNLTINQVRGRADVKMPPITETNSDKLRELLRNERRVELAFEGIRYWDLLRWKLAETVLVGEVWGAPYPKSTTYAGYQVCRSNRTLPLVCRKTRFS